MPHAMKPAMPARPVPGAQGELRIAPLRPIVPLLREAGIDPLPLLRRHGLRASDFDNPERRFEYLRMAALIEDAAAATGFEDFGLRIGQRFELKDLGLLASLMLAAPTVGQALANLARWFHLHDRGAVPVLRDAGEGLVSLGYGFLQHDVPGADQVLGVAIMVACKILRELCGPLWQPVQVCLAHRAPRRAADYRRHFRAPVRFDAAHSELQFDGRWLAAPVAGGDAVRLAVLHDQAEHDDASRQRSLGERARSAAQLLTLQGRLDEPALAAALGLQARTMRRRLHAEGTRLQSIAAQARFEWARQLLQHTRLPVADIAAALHYADATAFARAFRGWSGLPPSRWRALRINPPAAP
jgi:AraC-like DNA-binding protein